jgi:predicted lipid-binding transport protein (Tim44 family)
VGLAVNLDGLHTRLKHALHLGRADVLHFVWRREALILAVPRLHMLWWRCLKALIPWRVLGRTNTTALAGKHIRMNGQIDLITLISVIVLAVVIFKLRSVLGSRTDEDDNRVERLKTRSRDAARAPVAGAGGDVITLPRRARDDASAVTPTSTSEEADARVRAYAAIDPSVTEGLLDVAKYDSAFEPEAFLKGARAAYEMIVTAFAAGDRKTLKDLLSRDVYDGFVAAIADRESRGERVEQQFVGIKKADIYEAEMKAGTAFMTVRFVSELITASIDRAGTVLSGDPSKVTDVTDIWTFSRDLSNARALANLNWRLMATQAPN